MISAVVSVVAVMVIGTLGLALSALAVGAAILVWCDVRDQLSGR